MEVLSIPEDARSPRELERGSRIELHEEQADARVCRDVAEGLEHVVPGIVGEAKRPLAHHVHEARQTAAMRGIGAGAGVSARYEERVSALDGGPLCRAEGLAVPAVPRPLMRDLRLGRSRLDVFGAIAEDFVDPDVDVAGPSGDGAPIETEPPPSRRIENENADGLTVSEARADGIGGGQLGDQAQGVLVRCGDESGLSHDQ